MSDRNDSRESRRERAYMREAAAWMYQFAGAVHFAEEIVCPVEVLDNLSALAAGKNPPHAWPYVANVQCVGLAEGLADTARLNKLEAHILNGSDFTTELLDRSLRTALDALGGDE